jgi:predicted amidophosphoribosyltransferase
VRQPTHSGGPGRERPLRAGTRSPLIRHVPVLIRHTCRGTIASMSRSLIALLAPPACAACRGPLPREGPALCPECTQEVVWLRGGCPRCALPGHHGRGCPAAAAAFDRAWAPVAYAGAGAALVRAVKFARLVPVLDAMGAALAAGLPHDLRGLPLVPVPPQPLRSRRRGFDPAEGLVERLAARTGAPVDACLRRCDRGGRHTRLGRRDRRRATPTLECEARPPARLLLIDDVHTTGATLDACARALKEQGAVWVAAATYARTL